MACAAAVRPFVELVSLSNFLPLASGILLGRRHFTSSAAGFAGGGSSGVGSEPPGQGGFAVDTKYRSATEVIWPATKHQERFASRLHTALSTVLIENASLRETLVQQLGFAVKDVRMSPDNLKAFILWDSFTGQPGPLQRELGKQMPKLRSAVARALKARNVPQLVFRHDGLNDKQRELEDVFRRLDEEDEQGEGQVAGPMDEWGAAGSGGAGRRAK